ncbi:Arsenite efflux membrane protein ArsB [Beijerinckiaceae bacterium RH AL1]|nr:arsenic transporter [Beijerinckiaceae bacterium]VVB46818.1 Arsenite efflux membrane protein ArsB [Beijerinckiaceae bacterium RH CH11]VVB46901.1 Arsenite efflux membrane protein ArsB [Beijerinckiaceae bacterium RH AL8]VVC55574.1 Arsenite efflux membrane protein ArsB [Beijerinckiaceae bacterium RH AL1]
MPASLAPWLTPHVVTWTIIALSVLGVILRPFRWPEFIWAATGAILLVALRLLPPAAAWDGVLKGLDVYLFLIGMMALAEVARREGLFDWLATLAVRQSKGSASRLFALVYAVGTVVTVFLSNDATAVVLTPAVYAAAKAAKAEPLPYLFICALIANAASFVLPISNPANLVVFRDHMPPLAQWLLRFGVASIASIVVTFLVLRWSQRKQLQEAIATDVEAKRLSLSGRIAGLGIIATGIALIAASAFDIQLGLPTFVAGLLTVAIVLAVKREGPWETMKGISWSVIPLVAGLFVLVQALETSGVLALLGDALKNLAQRSDLEAGWISGAVVAVACNLVNNLPAGLLAGAAVHAAHVSDKVAGAILVGVDLGPNLSVTGSLATILWLTAIRREGEDVSAWTFLKLGLLAMPPALLAALAGLLLLP